MLSKNKRLRIMAGPNGSGKTTILRAVQSRFYSGPFVNADDIEKKLIQDRRLDLHDAYGLNITCKDFTGFLKKHGTSWKVKANSEHAAIGLACEGGQIIAKDHPSPYDAALVAEFIRYQLLKNRNTFTFETVLSHPSKIEFIKTAKKSGYKNYLYFICTNDPAINIARVHQRVNEGGHSVPEKKIIKRYTESLQLLASIIPYCYRVYLFDNSSNERRIEPVAEIGTKGEFISRTDKMPWWIDRYVVKALYK